MPETYQRKKPKTVTYAVYALLTWTAWTCFYGTYDTWVQLPSVEKVLNEQVNTQTQGMYSITLPTELMMKGAVAFYVLTAVVTIFFIYKIAKGKRWARASALWGFIIEAVLSVVWIAALFMFGEAPSLTDWLAYIPDYGLQAYALYLLYTWPGERWFDPTPITDQ